MRCSYKEVGRNDLNDTFFALFNFPNQSDLEDGEYYEIQIFQYDKLGIAQKAAEAFIRYRDKSIVYGIYLSDQATNIFASHDVEFEIGNKVAAAKKAHITNRLAQGSSK